MTPTVSRTVTSGRSPEEEGTETRLRDPLAELFGPAEVLKKKELKQTRIHSHPVVLVRPKS